MKKKFIILGIVSFVFISIIICVLGIKNYYKNLKIDIIGTWYTVTNGGTLYSLEFKEDGTYVEGLERDDEGVYTYDKDTGEIVLKTTKYQLKSPGDIEVKIVETGYNYFVTYDSWEKEYQRYEKKKSKAKAVDHDYKFYDVDYRGMAIDDGVLEVYKGNKKTLRIPSNVHTIGSSAFSADYDRALKTKKVIIPGTVKTIEKSAFMFSDVSVIVMEEGVETIGDFAFADACLTEIHFPKSIKNIGSRIFDAEADCNPIKIYVYKDSYAYKELKANEDMIYSEEVKFIFEK